MHKSITPFILTGLSVVFSTCSKEEDYTNEGHQAAIEFCECYKENSKEKCLEQLKNKYEAYRYMSEEFIESFNKTNNCDIELIIEQVK